MPELVRALATLAIIAAAVCFAAVFPCIIHHTATRALYFNGIAAVPFRTATIAADTADPTTLNITFLPFSPPHPPHLGCSKRPQAARPSRSAMRTRTAARAPQSRTVHGVHLRISA